MAIDLTLVRPVRTGEELDLPKLKALFLDRIPGIEGEPSVHQFRSGFSNLTYLISFGEKEYVLRCPPNGRIAATAHDMGREYRILSGLHSLFPLCPEVLFFCSEASPIGKPFYVMEKLPGVVLRKDTAKHLKLSPERFSTLCQSLIDTHADLHRLDYTRLEFAKTAKPEGYGRRQVEGWSERYRKARTPNAPKLTWLIDWLDRNYPDSSGRTAFIHNDFKLDNLLLDPLQNFAVSGVLDWEMATVGDPLMDLGCSLAYWVEAGDPWYLKALSPQPTARPGAWTRQRLADRYADRMGIDTSALPYHYCFGLFRIAGIAQQIYHRYYHGHTKDKRFRKLILAVYALEATAKRAIRQKTI